MKTILTGLIAIALALGALYAFNAYIYSQKQSDTDMPTQTGAADFIDATFMIDGQPMTIAEGNAQPSGTEARYFGNELRTDLDGDGREDVAFVVTHDGGGSGTFFYAVASRNTPGGWVGSDGYLLGDRIAPQSTTVSPNARHVNVVVFNYADRAQGEPMTAQPSVGKSAYLKLDGESMRWGVVEPDFEGESR